MRVLRSYKPIWFAAMIAWCMASGTALGDSGERISPFLSSSFDRTVHGNDHVVDLSHLGRADAFVGVDSLSDADRQYLTSGLAWRSNGSDARLVHVSALRTEGRGEQRPTGQTLVRAGNRLDLGSRWYLPEFTSEIAQVSNNGAGDAGLGGRAARFGLSEGMGIAQFNLGYFRADQSFDALGSSIAPGDRGLELQSQVDIADSWHVAHGVRFQQATDSRVDTGVAQSLVISRQPTLLDIGDPWRFSADVGAPRDTAESDAPPIALTLGTQTARWRSWRLDGSVGWYSGGVATPLALPVDGGLWEVSASRVMNVAGLNTRITPRFSLGGSQYDGVGLGTRTGISLGLSRLSDNIDLNVDYLSSGWSSAASGNRDLQLTFNFTQQTSAVLPSLRSMASTLRLPWVPRD